jgi:hypothetical protein
MKGKKMGKELRCQEFFKLFRGDLQVDTGPNQNLYDAESIKSKPVKLRKSESGVSN